MERKQQKEFFKYLKKQFNEIYKNSDEAKKTYTVQEINGVDTNIEYITPLDWFTTEYSQAYTSLMDKIYQETAQVNIREEDK